MALIAAGIFRSGVSQTLLNYAYDLCDWRCPDAALSSGETLPPFFVPTIEVGWEGERLDIQFRDAFVQRGCTDRQVSDPLRKAGRRGWADHPQVRYSNVNYCADLRNLSDLKHYYSRELFTFTRYILPTLPHLKARRGVILQQSACLGYVLIQLQPFGLAVILQRSVWIAPAAT